MPGTPFGWGQQAVRKLKRAQILLVLPAHVSDQDGALSPSTNALKPRGPHMWCNLLSITISLPAWRAYSSALPRALTRYDRRVFRLEPDLTSRRGRPARPRRAGRRERFDYEPAPGDDQSLRLPQCAPLTAQGRTGSVASRESLPCACASLWMWPTPRLSSFRLRAATSRSLRRGAVRGLSGPVARQMLRCFAFHCGPKHASWINIVEIEIGAVHSQCLDRRVAERDRLVSALAAWARQRHVATPRGLGSRGGSRSGKPTPKLDTPIPLNARLE